MSTTSDFTICGVILLIFLLLRWNFSREIKKKEKESQVQEHENTQEHEGDQQ